MGQRAYVNAHLLLLKGDQVLLSLRQNTGYEDGNWSFVSGHVEMHESAISGLVREAREEIGVQIDASHLSVSHVMHRKTERENMDIFISCNRWTNEITNQEPVKCGDLGFFSLNALPKNIIPYVATAIFHIQNNQFYSEYGWGA